MTAEVAYTRLMATVRAAGGLVPCVGRREWSSSRPAERAAAAARCTGCPALAACLEYATVAGVNFGVWAGADRTPRPTGRPPGRANASAGATQQAERIEATRRLTTEGVAAWKIAELLGVTESSVRNYRRALRSAS